ncbi:hypothetical protein [Kitasatospora sp. NPDC057015]|uniref:hypothetical protein n=1 Tax=Kitasatospora sp. NPDC057015 TaxID=3346001 RepID=UPI0036406B26
MRITDARTGRSTEIRQRRSGLLRVRTRVGRPGSPFALSDLRALLVTDLLQRTSELRGPQVITSLGHPSAAPPEVKLLRQDADLLGIRPQTDDGDGPADLEVRSDQAVAAAAAPAPAPAGPSGPADPPPLVDVARATAAFLPEGSAPSGPLAGLTPDGLEPLAVRLALLGTQHHLPVELTADVLAGAQATLDRWRRLVAECARTPSRPPIADAVQDAFDGFADDLDAAPALRLLDGLAARTDLPPGAVFETFVRVDQVLALELSRDVGRSSR